MSHSFSSSFCQYYDMQEHSTKIFRDIIMTMGSFLQSLFAGPSPSSPTSAATSSVSSTSSTMSVGSTGAGSGTTSIPSGAALFSPTHSSRRGFISGSHFISSSDLLASRTLKPVMYSDVCCFFCCDVYGFFVDYICWTRQSRP